MKLLHLFFYGDDTSVKLGNPICSTYFSYGDESSSRYGLVAMTSRPNEHIMIECIKSLAQSDCNRRTGGEMES